MVEARPDARARRSFAVERDERILRAMRDRLIEQPDSSMTQLAAAAGVGMSAVYSRFGDRTALLRRFADEGNRDWAVALERALSELDAGADAWQVFAELVGTEQLAEWVALSAAVFWRFERTREELTETMRLNVLAERLFARLRAAGALRAGFTFDDLGKLLEGFGAIRGDGLERSRELQARYRAVLLEGLRPHLPELPGTSAEPRDFIPAARRTTPPNPPVRAHSPFRAGE